jgi:hypothetical protein
MEFKLGTLNLLLHFHSLGVLLPIRVKMAESTTPPSRSFSSFFVTAYRRLKAG